MAFLLAVAVSTHAGIAKMSGALARIHCQFPLTLPAACTQYPRLLSRPASRRRLEAYEGRSARPKRSRPSRAQQTAHVRGRCPRYARMSLRHDF